MAHTNSSSVANLRAIFEANATKPENKPIQRPRAKTHSSADYWRNAFKIKQSELRKGPSQILHDNWDHEEHNYEPQQSNMKPGKIKAWNPEIKKFPSKQNEVGKLSISDQFKQQLSACREKKEPQNDTVPDETKEEINIMMTCEPEQVIPPSIPQAPSADARAYFSDQWIGPGWAIPYDTKGTWASISDYVGAGSYPNNLEAFPNAARGTFDAIAIDSNTRVILWEKPNFEGKVLLDMTGPALINNVAFKSYSAAQALFTNTFQDPEIEKNYPPSVRVWSETNMQSWTTGSVKIVAAAK